MGPCRWGQAWVAWCEDAVLYELLLLSAVSYLHLVLQAPPPHPQGQQRVSSELPDGSTQAAQTALQV